MLRVLELFGGIGACSEALSQLGIEYEIADYVEIDEYAVKSFNAIHGTDFKPQDITKWNKDIQVDFILHGSPCQDFSVAGKNAGGDEGSGTRSSLLYETLRIVQNLAPKYVIWENVKNLLSKKHRHNFDAYLKRMEDLGYKNYYQVLNAKDYGVPQNRERVFTISILGGGEFKFPEPFELTKRLKDILEDKVDEKYYISTRQLNGMATTNYASYKLSKLLKDKESTADTIKARFEGCLQLVEQPLNLKQKLCNRLIDEHVVKGGEIINHSYTTSEQRNTLDKYIETADGTSPTLTTRPDILGYVEGGKQLNIRKLTPKECWRLMGFSDDSFEKAAKVNSNAQLYKQAGNSICVDVLKQIFKELF